MTITRTLLAQAAAGGGGLCVSFNLHKNLCNAHDTITVHTLFKPLSPVPPLSCESVLVAAAFSAATQQLSASCAATAGT